MDDALTPLDAVADLLDGDRPIDDVTRGRMARVIRHVQNDVREAPADPVPDSAVGSDPEMGPWVVRVSAMDLGRLRVLLDNVAERSDPHDAGLLGVWSRWIAGDAPLDDRTVGTRPDSDPPTSHDAAQGRGGPDRVDDDPMDVSSGG